MPAVPPPETLVRPLLFVALSLALHAGLLASWAVKTPPSSTQDLRISLLAAPVQAADTASRKARAKVTKASAPVADSSQPAPKNAPASMPAPPAPSAEEWRIASTYTLKNSKRYRHNWGQLVRSKMGTAVEGPGQGMVRFRIEIAPDGKIAKVDELWATSEMASKLAWQAIRTLPPLPPTPTGKPLVFEQTIAFMPFETGWPPSYKLDCLPDPPTFGNPFAWDGSSTQPAARALPESDSSSSRPPPPTDCPTDSTSESIEEEERELKRQMDQWRWGR